LPHIFVRAGNIHKHSFIARNAESLLFFTETVPSTVRWFVDKKSRIPLYLQLKDLIQYHISTGNLLQGQQLPTVSDLSKDLGITFETVRKSYKELERDGLIQATRGRGTHVIGFPGREISWKPQIEHESDLHNILKQTLRDLFARMQSEPHLRTVVESAIREILLEKPKPFVIFTECNQLQVGSVSKVLETYLSESVLPTLLEDLAAVMEETIANGRPPSAVITTGFHFREVRQLLRDYPVAVDFVITRMSPQTRRQLDSYSKAGRFAFVCRDQSSQVLYRDLLKDELDLQADLECFTLDGIDLPESLAAFDVLLVSPTVHDEVKKMAGPTQPVFNVFDWIDPLSLEAIKTRIAVDGTQNLLLRSEVHD